MKKKIFSLACITLLFFSACKKDYLTRDPLDAYSNTSLWSSQSDAQAALNGCYNGWESAYSMYYLDAVSDNLFSQYYWEGYTLLGNGTATPSDPYGINLWDYTTIQKCNWFLANIDGTPMDATLKAQYKGEAKFLRAYKYFMMTQLYGDVPLVKTSVTPTEANTISRTAAATVRSFVLSELDSSAAVLPTSYTGSDVGRITKGAALSLKARIELFDKNYTACITDCQKVMALGYSLFPSYGDLFRIGNENNSEVILDVQYKENDYSNGTVGVFPSSSFGGWSSLDPTQAVVDAYEMSNGKTIDDATAGYNAASPFANRDPRLAASIIYPGLLYQGKYYNSIQSSSGDYYLGGNNSATGYLVKKYISNLSTDYDDMWNTGLNAIIIRYAEILLTYAEAKIESGSIDATVYNAINLVRNRAGMPSVDQTVYNNQTTLRTLVRRERRAELAFEGLRWFDIQRWQIGTQVRGGTVYGTKLGTVDATTGATTFTGNNVTVEPRAFNTNRDYLWPVPQSQLDINKNITQNNGY